MLAHLSRSGLKHIRSALKSQKNRQSHELNLLRIPALLFPSGVLLFPNHSHYIIDVSLVYSSHLFSYSHQFSKISLNVSRAERINLKMKSSQRESGNKMVLNLNVAIFVACCMEHLTAVCIHGFRSMHARFLRNLKLFSFFTSRISSLAVCQILKIFLHGSILHFVVQRVFSHFIHSRM